MERLDCGKGFCAKGFKSFYYGIVFSKFGCSRGCMCFPDIHFPGGNQCPRQFLECADPHLGLNAQKRGLITDLIIDNMKNWHHSGFNVYCGKTLWPGNDDGMENPARYIIQASFSSQRMTYIPGAETRDSAARVLYESKNGRFSKTFNALDWLARLTTHISNRREHMVRYYGYYSNKSRGMRKKAGF